MGAKQSRRAVDVSSQDVSSQDVSSQDVSSQDVSSQDVSSQEVVDVSSVDVSSQDVSGQADVSGQVDVSSQEVAQIAEPRGSQYLVTGVGCCSSSVSRVVIDNVPQNPDRSSAQAPVATPEKV
jgi:hypothetical protein